MIDYKEAQQILGTHAKSFGRERVALDQARERVLTEQIRADRDYPPFNRSTMDGYAIRYSDWENGIRDFSIAEIIYPGVVHTRTIGPGQCYKIMTGAAVPHEADAVMRKEEVGEDGQWIHTGQSACLPFQNIARRGEDLQSGELAIQTTRLCDPSVMGLLASLGRTQVEVERLPAVSLFTTGNEVVPFDAHVSSFQIRNSNRWIMESLFANRGILPRSSAHLRDDRGLLRSSLEGSLESDLIVMSGGVSAGDADFVPDVLEEIGVKRLFHKVAIKPGKPIWCGILPNGGMVFALPGNPFSCLVTF
jgi:molybdopterin molybdotransferase